MLSKLKYLFKELAVEMLMEMLRANFYAFRHSLTTIIFLNVFLLSIVVSYLVFLPSYIEDFHPLKTVHFTLLS